MKVKKLIEMLKIMPPDAEVRVWHYDDDSCDPQVVSATEVSWKTDNTEVYIFGEY